MGNVYRVILCECCRTPHIAGEEAIVHSSKNLRKFFEEYEELGWDGAIKNFCANCGGYIPCGCDSPRSQG